MKQYLECHVCHSKEQRLLLHNIRLRGEYHKLCTSCVLKHHTGSFCPHCFEIYEGFNPPADCVTCLKCESSLSHLACVGKDVVTRYFCPSCLYPAYVYFDVAATGGGGGGGGLNNKNKNTNTNTSSTQAGGSSSSSSNKKIIDIKLSKILLTAAQFASVSMKRGATAERVEAEKRVKEALVMRKRAREALQEVHSTALRLKGNGNESRMMMIQGIPSPVAVEEPSKKPKGNTAIAIALAAQKIKTDQKRIQNQNQNQNLASSSSMALIEGNNPNVGPVVGLHAPRVVQTPFTNGAPAPAPPPPPAAAAAAAVSNNDKLKGSPKTVMGYQQFRNVVTVNGKEKSLNISQLRINDAKVESENNGLPVVPKTEGLLQHPQINHPIKEDPDEVKEFGDSRRFPKPIQSNEGSADAFNSRNNKGVLHTGSSKTMS